MGALIQMFLPQAWKMPTRNTASIPPHKPRGTITFVLRRTGINERFSQHWNLMVGSAFRSSKAGGVWQRSSQGHAHHPLQIRRQHRQQNLRRLTLPLQPRAGAAEMQLPPPSLSFHIVVARCHHHPHPHHLLIVDCCFHHTRPCHRRWRRHLLLPMASLRSATAVKDDSAKADEGVKLLLLLSSCSRCHRPPLLSPLCRHPPTHVVVFLFVAISSSPL